MSPRSVPESCAAHRCRRRFGGAETERRHRTPDRCLSDHQLALRDIVPASDGIYRRTMQAHLPGILRRVSDQPETTQTAATPVLDARDPGNGRTTEDAI